MLEKIPADDILKCFSHIFPEKGLTVFDLITAHTPISAQSSNSLVFRLQLLYFLSTSLLGIYCGYPFELHRQVDAIQMSIHNISFYKENQKKKQHKTLRKHH